MKCDLSENCRKTLIWQVSEKYFFFILSFIFFFLGTNPLIPYGLPCVRELFRFLVSLINPLDRHNTDVMIHMGLSLLTVALESGADSIRTFKSLLYLVKDEMCRNLFTVSFNIVFLLFCLDTRFSFYYFLLFSKLKYTNFILAYK